MTSFDIVDPKFRRLRKALFKAEQFMFSSDFSERARGRYNSIIGKAIKAGAFASLRTYGGRRA